MSNGLALLGCLLIVVLMLGLVATLPGNEGMAYASASGGALSAMWLWRAAR